MSRATLEINYWPFLHSYGHPTGFSYKLSLAIVHVASLAYPTGLTSGPIVVIDNVLSHPNMKSMSSVALLIVEYLFRLHDDIIIHATRQREVTLVTREDKTQLSLICIYTKEIYF